MLTAYVTHSFVIGNLGVISLNDKGLKGVFFFFWSIFFSLSLISLSLFYYYFSLCFDATITLIFGSISAAGRKVNFFLWGKKEKKRENRSREILSEIICLYWEAEIITAIWRGILYTLMVNKTIYTALSVFSWPLEYNIFSDNFY